MTTNFISISNSISISINISNNSKQQYYMQSFAAKSIHYCIRRALSVQHFVATICIAFTIGLKWFECLLVFLVCGMHRMLSVSLFLCTNAWTCKCQNVSNFTYNRHKNQTKIVYNINNNKSSNNASFSSTLQTATLQKISMLMKNQKISEIWNEILNHYP